MTTNYEKIKAMSIKEMAKFLDDFGSNSCDYCGSWQKESKNKCYLNCDSYLKQWLEQEAE